MIFKTDIKLFLPLSDIGGIPGKFEAWISNCQAIAVEGTLFPFGDFPVAQFPHNGQQGFALRIGTQDGDTFFVGGIDVKGKFIKTAPMLVADFQPYGERTQFIARKAERGGVGIKFVIHLPLVSKGQRAFGLAD